MEYLHLPQCILHATVRSGLVCVAYMFIQRFLSQCVERCAAICDLVALVALRLL